MVKYYIQNGNCGTEAAFKIIGAKWKSTILDACMNHHNCSYQSLKQTFPEITESILTKQLKELVDDEMLKIKNSNVKKSKTIYVVTKKTTAVIPIIELLNQLADICNYNNSGYTSKVEYMKYLIGNKWKSRILWVIYHCEVIRFNELQNSIEGISHKILIECLNSLIENNFVIKTDYNEKSPRVEYSLTENGKTAYKIIKMMADWCLEYKLITPIITINY